MHLVPHKWWTYTNEHIIKNNRKWKLKIRELPDFGLWKSTDWKMYKPIQVSNGNSSFTSGLTFLLDNFFPHLPRQVNYSQLSELYCKLNHHKKRCTIIICLVGAFIINLISVMYQYLSRSIKNKSVLLF